MIDAHFVLIAAEKLEVSPQRIFGLAIEWSEEPHNSRWVIDQYNDWYYSGNLKPLFENFVIDVMANRVSKPL